MVAAAMAMVDGDSDFSGGLEKPESAQKGEEATRVQKGKASPALSAQSTVPSPAFSSLTLLSSPLTSIPSSCSEHSKLPSEDFYLAASPGRQVGLYAARPLQRGDRILAEKPLLTVPSPSSLPTAIYTLSAAEREAYLTLSNAYANDPSFSPEEGIFQTNAFSLSATTRLPSASLTGSSTPCYGIFPITARLNHSCLPNVKSSYLPSSTDMQIHVLRPIEPPSYLGRRDLFGSTTSQRKDRLKRNWAFDCSCSLCEADPSDVAASDTRRSTLADLHARLPGLRPSNVEQTLRDCAFALTLLEQEGLFLDRDVFCTAAARACAWHQDWKAARVWAKAGWESAKAEYGQESELARRLEEGWKNPRGMLPRGPKGEKKALARLTGEMLGSRPSPGSVDARINGVLGRMKQKLGFA
ncbi:hypothetical protein JCM11251_000935 [Rhodosporidiobolus azoricus]